MWIIQKIVSKGEYNYAVVPEHPNATSNGYVLEHRVVMENAIGRLLEQWELVHHIDENKKNNAIENLQILTIAEHNQHHAPDPEYIILKCDECGSEFARRANQRAEVKKYKNAFCSRSCNGKFQRRKQLS